MPLWLRKWQLFQNKVDRNHRRIKTITNHNNLKMSIYVRITDNVTNDLVIVLSTMLSPLSAQSVKAGGFVPDVHAPDQWDKTCAKYLTIPITKRTIDLIPSHLWPFITEQVI